MARPTLVTVQGTYVKPNGEPESGRVTFHVPGYIRHGASDDVMVPGKIVGVLDADGDLSVQVPATDDPAWSPVGWSYTVDLRLHESSDSFSAVIPYDSPGGILDLSDLLPVPASGGVLYAAAGHAHADYATDAELTSALAGYVTTTALSTTLSGYATDAELAAGDAAVAYTANQAYDAATAPRSGFVLVRSGVPDVLIDNFGGVAVVSNPLAVIGAGNGLRLPEGANAKMGLITLAAGTATVATTAVGANSRVFLTCQTPGGTPGFLRVSARTAGASFTVLSSSNTDTSQVAWMIVDPS